ncbi:hypothetical protein N7527_005979 [Penicillium freii]|nr:hypothetical protein N7527_005979 [Penicillium freii]
MFKTGCLYSAHAFFLRDVVHRASIKLELALNLKSHILYLYNKIQQFQGSSFVPKISGKTVDASGLAGGNQPAAPPFCLLPARPASLHVGSSLLSSLLSTNTPLLSSFPFDIPFSLPLRQTLRDNDLHPFSLI